MGSHQPQHQPVSQVNTEPGNWSFELEPWLLYPVKVKSRVIFRISERLSSLLHRSLKLLAFSSGFMWHSTVQQLKSVTRFNCGLLRICTVRSVYFSAVHRRYNIYYSVNDKWPSCPTSRPSSHGPGAGRSTSHHIYSGFLLKYTF